MTTTSPITSDMYLKNRNKAERQTGSSALGKDDFLKLLMTQLANQDPTNPMEDREFIAQMAQFSTLEQMTNMATQFEKLAMAQMQSQMIEYNNFIGKEVKWHEVTEELDANNKPVINEGTSKIVSVKYKDGGVEFTLEDGKKLTPGNISEILAGAGNSNSLVEASMMIGKTVTYNDGTTDITAQVESVSKKDGKIVLNLVGGEAITSEQITSISM